MKAIISVNGKVVESKNFNSTTSAREWADDKIDDYAMEYDGDVTERSPNRYEMESEDANITIEIKK